MLSTSRCPPLDAGEGRAVRDTDETRLGEGRTPGTSQRAVRRGERTGRLGWPGTRHGRPQRGGPSRQGCARPEATWEGRVRARERQAGRWRARRAGRTRSACSGQSRRDRPAPAPPRWHDMRADMRAASRPSARCVPAPREGRGRGRRRLPPVTQPRTPPRPVSRLRAPRPRVL